MIPVLSPDPQSAFPPIEQALDYPQGLLAMGNDLSPERLVNAYRQGIFPWYSEGQPILWWSPVPRCVLVPKDVHVSRRLRRRYNQGKVSLTADRAFDQVVEACAQPRDDDDGTWITADMCAAYLRLHEMGIAHSVEVWDGDLLVGGIYGLSLGRVFFGESMFSRQQDASKIALVALCKQLNQWNYRLLDCQVTNAHLLSMGAVEITRSEFRRYLAFAADSDRWGATFTSDARW